MTSSDSTRVKDWIRSTAKRYGFQAAGFTNAEPLIDEAFDLNAWLAAGRHGSMHWMARRRSERVAPQAYYPEARTIVSLLMNYHVPHSPTRTAGPHWSSYARGEDYHQLVRKRLQTLLADIRAEFPGADGICCVDSAPVMEKVLAQRAGLGWQGKHTNLITRQYGSWIFLAELLLNMELTPDQPFSRDFCGSCTACLDACPTGALDQPHRIAAQRCISYLTIEHKGRFTTTEAGQLHGWIYGCDICQDICPWNRRFAQPTSESAFFPRAFFGGYDWSDWGELTEEAWETLLKGNAARRTGYHGLMRNIAAARR